MGYACALAYLLLLLVGVILLLQRRLIARAPVEVPAEMPLAPAVPRGTGRGAA